VKDQVHYITRRTFLTTVTMT